MANDSGGMQPTNGNDATSNALSSANMVTPPPSAGSRVASIPELLEKILLDLANGEPDGPTLRAVLTSARASRTFRETINGSAKLQHALFLSAQKSKVFLINPMFDIPIRLTDGSKLVVDTEALISNEYFELRMANNGVARAQSQKDKAASWRRMYPYRGNNKLLPVFVRTGDLRLTECWKFPKLGEVFDWGVGWM